MAQNSSSNPPIDPALKTVDNVSDVPLTAYEHLRPRQGKSGAVEGPPPGHRQQVIARTSVSTDRAGASLSIQTVAAGDRARTLKEYQEGTPAPVAQPDRTSATVAENRTSLGQSPLWTRRQKNSAQGR
jgi:hypothetical protein